jgi:hypothetical protein
VSVGVACWRFHAAIFLYDTQTENGPDSAYLPDAEAALSYADYTIGELRKKSGYEDDLSLMMIASRADGFVLAVFPWLLKAFPLPARRGAPDCGEFC